MNWRSFLLFASMSCAVVVLVAGCGLPCGAGSHLRLRDAPLQLDCEIKKVRTKEVSRKDRDVSNLSSPLTFVYARLNLANTGKGAVRYNLLNYLLKMNGEHSGKPYIDSIASYLITDRVLPPQQSVSYDVVWVFTAPLNQCPAVFEIVKAIEVSL